MATNLWIKRHGMYEILPGARIQSTIAEAIKLSASQGELVVFEFNTVTVCVLGDSDADLIYRDWSRAMDLCIGPIVGPHPAVELSEPAREADAMMRRVGDSRREKYFAQQRAEDEAHRQRVVARLDGAPPINLADPEIWQKFVKTNGEHLMIYPEQWARLMQLEIAQGQSLADVADATSHEADTQGITGSMYGFFVGVLAQCWVHGEELRRWHNLRFQLQDEGERANEAGTVLNPALIHVECQ